MVVANHASIAEELTCLNGLSVGQEMNSSPLYATKSVFDLDIESQMENHALC